MACRTVREIKLRGGYISAATPDGIRHLTNRILLGISTPAVLLLELGGAATWYEEWDLMGIKTRFWLAFCALLGSMTELVIAHIVPTLFLSKIIKVSDGEPDQLTSGGKVNVNNTCFPK